MTARAREERDTVTVLRAVDGAVLTKRITRSGDSGFEIAPYDRGLWFTVEEVPVNGVVELGQLLERLERDPHACLIRGRPLPDVDRAQTRRLLYPQLEEDGTLVPETFEAAARRYIALDFDDLPVPLWNEDDLARRRKAIARDRAEHPRRPPKTEDDGEDYDLAGEEDPAPIDPARDWSLICRAAISTLPVEFHNAHAWWQMTSSAGIKTDIRMRLWFWLDRLVTDAEAKRWLADSPVDCSLYSAVQVHYTSAPIFEPRSADPVPCRSGMWWRHVDAVSVPELPEPEFVPVESVISGDWQRPANATGDPTRRAEAYAKAALHGVETAAPGGRHPTLMGVTVRLYSLADAGLLDPGDVTRRLLEAAQKPLSDAERRQRCVRLGGRPSANEQAIDWARAKAKASPDLPNGFLP